MERLEKVLRTDMEVFDVGTGSGILAIAAAKLGAKTVKAVDIDATAVRVAIENIAGNELTEKIVCNRVICCMVQKVRLILSLLISLPILLLCFCRIFPVS